MPTSSIGTHDGAGGAIFARERALTVLDESVDGLSERRASPLVRGESGIGMYTLLAAADRRSRASCRLSSLGWSRSVYGGSGAGNRDHRTDAALQGRRPCHEPPQTCRAQALVGWRKRGIPGAARHGCRTECARVQARQQGGIGYGRRVLFPWL
jgi:hypothetical protein